MYAELKAVLFTVIFVIVAGFGSMVIPYNELESGMTKEALQESYSQHEMRIRQADKTVVKARVPTTFFGMIVNSGVFGWAIVLYGIVVHFLLVRAFFRQRFANYKTMIFSLLTPLFLALVAIPFAINNFVGMLPQIENVKEAFPLVWQVITYPLWMALVVSLWSILLLFLVWLRCRKCNEQISNEEDIVN
jgi:hypothetical protein